jgi:hypothetical protein
MLNPALPVEVTAYDGPDVAGVLLLRRMRLFRH